MTGAGRMGWAAEWVADDNSAPGGGIVSAKTLGWEGGGTGGTGPHETAERGGGHVTKAFQVI